MSRTKRLLIFVGALVVILGAVLYFTLSHPLFAYNARIEVTTAKDGYGCYEQSEQTANGLRIRYVFSYYSNQSFYVFQDWSPRVPMLGQQAISPSQIFHLTEGATYKYLGVEMIVSEVYSGYFVLLVRNIS